VRQKPPTTATPQPTPASQSQPVAVSPPATPTPSAPIPIVTVNGQTLSTADFDPALRGQLESLETKIGEAKRQVLDLQINTTLLETEARRRGISSHQLYELEVSKRVPVATPAQIKQFIDDNKSQFEGVDSAAATPQVVALL